MGTRECSVCGEENEVCCSHATYDDGTHVDPVCRKCCGPHHKIQSGVGDYERTDCDQ